MNFPNALTMVRLVLIPVYLFVYFSRIPTSAYWALGIILFAGVTDIVDGYLARRNNQTTEFGALLDPLADKMLMIAVFVSLLISGKISFWQAFVICLRDVAMIFGTVAFRFKGKKTMNANVLGKATTVLFYIALILVMFNFPIANTFLWYVILFSYVTSLVYTLQVKQVNRPGI